MKKVLFIIILVVVGIKVSGQTPHASRSYLLDIRPEYVEIPFSIQERDLFVEASVNGKKGKFHWDTGAPGLIINKEAFTEDELSIDGSFNNHASGATGAISNISKLKIKEFRLEGLLGNDIGAMGMNLGHLTVPSLGLLGAKLMEGYHTIFDLKSQKIKMYKNDDHGNIMDKSVLNGFDKIEVEKYAHLPMITIEINGQKLNMVLDSGCSTMMINPEYKDILAGSYEFSHKDTLRGGGKEIKDVEAYYVNKLKFGNHTFENVKVFFEVGIQSQKEGLVIDGIIGWDIFWHSTIAYNLDNNLIYIKKN